MAQPDHVASARAVYDASAERYVEFAGHELSAATEGPLDRAVLAAFVEMVSAAPGGRVADVGCGPGRVAAHLDAHGLDVIGVDVSPAMVACARRAHPGIRFEEGRLDQLPLADGTLVAAASWYSIIHTPPDHLDEVFTELRRALRSDGLLLLAFQAGQGEPVRRPDAHGTALALTSYRHRLDDVARRAEVAGFAVHATAQRAPELPHESTPQAFLIARGSGSVAERAG